MSAFRLAPLLLCAPWPLTAASALAQEQEVETAEAGCIAWTLDITNNSDGWVVVREYLGEKLVLPDYLTYPSWPKGYRHWIGEVHPRGRKSWQLSGARPAVLIWPWVVASPDEQRWAGGPHAAGAAALRKLVTLKFTCASN